HRLAFGIEHQFAVFVPFHLRAGLRPVPVHLGRHATTGKLGNVTGLACHLAGVVIELVVDAEIVRLVAMTGLATGTTAMAAAGNVDAVGILGLHGITTAIYAVLVRGVAGG